MQKGCGGKPPDAGIDGLQGTKCLIMFKSKDLTLPDFFYFLHETPSINLPHTSYLDS